jgi:hypothetical protein
LCRNPEMQLSPKAARPTMVKTAHRGGPTFLAVLRSKL